MPHLNIRKKTASIFYGCFLSILQEHGLDNELMNLALLSSPDDMLDVARLDNKYHYIAQQSLLLVL